MGQSIISLDGSVTAAGSPTPWLASSRKSSARGGCILASGLNTDLLLYLCLPAGSEAPGAPLTVGQAGVRVIPASCWVEGTNLDPSSDIYLQGASGNQGYTCEDQMGFSPAGSHCGGFRIQP